MLFLFIIAAAGAATTMAMMNKNNIVYGLPTIFSFYTVTVQFVYMLSMLILYVSTQWNLLLLNYF